MNWSAAPDVDYDGRRWGQKNIEFMKIISLPRRVPEVALSVAVGQTVGRPFPANEATEQGWQVLDAQDAAADWIKYQQFIRESAGEFSVAKNTYVKANTGWFSCRSACYLAAGRPVVAQDTGWTHHLPHDQGLLSFSDVDQAADAIHRVIAEPQRHARQARQIAEEFFDSRRVLTDLLQAAEA